jgi:hypothetical protein
MLLSRVLRKDIGVRFALEYKSHSKERLLVRCLRFFDSSNGFHFFFSL